MKKYLFIVFFVILLVGGGVFLAYNVFFDKIVVRSSEAELLFIYGDKDVKVILSEEESQYLRTLFDGKRLYLDNPSCGFTQNVSIRFENSYFCIANDTCAIIKLNDKYFKVSESDREKINKIFEKYGGSFPCI